MSFFWRDEWESVLGGHAGVGHYLSYLHDNGEWYSAQIVGFDEVSGQHSVRFEVSAAQPALNSDSLNISINTAGGRIQWTDSSNIFKIKMSNPPGSCGRTSGEVAGKLAFSCQDAGKFVAIWWHRYNRNFYCKIQSYDSLSGEHRVVYQDGDVKQYDMASKLYEVLHPPAALAARISVDVPHVAATAVAAWHAGEMLRLNESADIQLKKSDYSQYMASHDKVSLNALQKGAVSLKISVDDVICIRGRPFSQSMSSYQVDLINIFYRNGGFNSIFKTLLESDSNIVPISCLSTNLRFAAQLEKLITPVAFQELSWNLKEGIPFAMSNLSDSQVKDLTPVIMSDITSILSKLVKAQQHSSKSFGTTMELFQMQIAAQLIRCSQLQKRFWGLSMICDRIENIAPAIPDYLKHRGSKPSNKQPSGNYSPADIELNRLQSQQRADISIPSMDLWLKNNNIVDIIFVQSFHQDLSARSDVVIVYLAMRRLMTVDHLNAMWSAASGGRHEAVVRVLHGLMIRIVPVLEPKLRQHLFGLISAVPFSEYSEQFLYFLKSFTVTCMGAMRAEKTSGNTSSAIYKCGKDENPLSDTTWRSVDPSGVVQRDNGGVTARNASVVSRRKGQVVVAPSRPWLGLGLLWAFVQDVDTNASNYFGGSGKIVVDEGLLIIAVRLFAELLNEEFRHEKEVVIQKCVENVHNSISVPTSLNILRSVFMSYRSTTKGWFGKGSSKENTLDAILENLNDVVGGNIIEMVLSELDIYMQAFRQQAGVNVEQPEASSFRMSRPKTESSLNNKRIIVNGKLCLVPHLRGIQDRLNFLQYILGVSSLVLSETHVQYIWNILVLNAPTLKTLDTCMMWLDSLLISDSRQLNNFLGVFILETTSSVGVGCETILQDQSLTSTGSEIYDREIFGSSVIQHILEKCMIPWAQSLQWASLSRHSVASVCFKLFLTVNIKHGLLQANSSEGKWYRSGNLFGMKLLWHLAADSAEQNIYNAAIQLLIELHYRVYANKLKSGEENTRDTFMKKCFNQLAMLIQTRVDTTSVASVSQPILFKQDSIIEHNTLECPTMISLKLMRYLSMLILFFKRFDSDDAAAKEAFTSLKVKNIHVRILAGVGETVLADFIMKSDDQFGMLREKVADHLQDIAAAFSMERLIKSGGGLFSATASTYELIRPDKNEMTLRDLKFATKGEIILVKRIARAMPLQGDNAEKAKFIDLITVKDLTTAQTKQFSGSPLEWLGLQPPQPLSIENDGSLKRSTSITSLSACAHNNDLNSSNSSNSGQLSYLCVPPVLPLPSHCDMVLANDIYPVIKEKLGLSSLQQYLSLYLHGKSEYFNLLLNMLDGFISVEMQVNSTILNFGCQIL